MSPWISTTATPFGDVPPLTMMFGGKAISLASDVGALALLHGALQSAISSVEDATQVEAAYERALDALPHS